jgi:hypothetical protein
MDFRGIVEKQLSQSQASRAIASFQLCFVCKKLSVRTPATAKLII